MATLSVTKSYTASSAKANVVFKLDYTVTTSDPAKVTVKANGLTVTLTSSGSGEALAIAKNNRNIALNNGLSVSLKLASTTMFTGLTVDSAGTYPVTGSSTTQDVSKAHSATSKTLTLTAAGVTNTATVSIPIRTSYTVTVNPNSGSGGTTSLKKWHGETLTLPNPTLSGFTAPTRSGWKFLGLNTSSSATSAQASYTANSAGTLYAVWQRQIGAVTLSVDTYRVADGSSSVEDDEGEWCYGVFSYNVTGAAPGTLTLTVSADPTCSIVQNTFTVSKLEDTALEGTVIFRASGCSVDETYVFSVHASCTNEATGVTQTPVTADLGDKLSPAYYPMDILGDGYYYNLTTDTAIDASKTYYTQSGDGSEDNPIVYTKVANPVAADLGEYYEANGERPAHGISFGAPCKREGFHVAMDLFFQQWAGIIQMFAGSTPPAGWLLCDGSAVSRTDYAVLFDAIGTTWGAGNGSTTFNLPDLRGRAPIGAGTGSGLTARTLGGKTGAEAVTLKAAESGLPAHTHGFTQPTISNHRHAATSTDGSRVIGYNYSTISTGASAVRVAAASSGSNYVPRVSHPDVNYSAFSVTGYQQPTATGGAVGAVTGGAQGASSAHNNMQPSAVVNFIIHTGKTS